MLHLYYTITFAFFKPLVKGYFFITEAQKSAYFTSPKTCCILFLQAGERIRPEAKNQRKKIKQEIMCSAVQSGIPACARNFLSDCIACVTNFPSQNSA